MNPLDVALNRMADLRAELAEIETFVRVYYRLFPEERLASKMAFGEMHVGAPRAVDNSVHKSVENVREQDVLALKRGRKRATDSLVSEMEGLIEAARKPLERGDLVSLLEQRGIVLPDTDKPRYVGTILWRNRDRFRNLPGHGYWLRSLPYPPAGYDPATDMEAARILDDEPAFVEQPRRDMPAGGSKMSLGDRMSSGLTEEIVEGWDEADDQHERV